MLNVTSGSSSFYYQAEKDIFSNSFIKALFISSMKREGSVAHFQLWIVTDLLSIECLFIHIFNLLWPNTFWKNVESSSRYSVVSA